MPLKEVLEKEGYKNLKRRILIALIILVTAVIIVLIYLLFTKAKPCENEGCFFDSLSKCKKVSLIKEDSEAVWFYRILGSEGKDKCEVEVKLLRLKMGTIKNEKLEGKSMTCTILRTSELYPEKRLEPCTGVLKEEMQDIIITRMHNYLIQNIGKISDEFTGL